MGFRSTSHKAEECRGEEHWKDSSECLWWMSAVEKTCSGLLPSITPAEVKGWCRKYRSLQLWEIVTPATPIHLRTRDRTLLSNVDVREPDLLIFLPPMTGVFFFFSTSSSSSQNKQGGFIGPLHHLSSPIPHPHKAGSWSLTKEPLRSCSLLFNQ